MKRLLILATVILLAAPARADDEPVIPTTDFAPARYEALWTKSPFAVATSEGPGETSPDYMLVGVAKIDNVSYASVVQVQGGEHFLISSDQPVHGMTLNTITHSPNSPDTFATITKDGQTLTLKLQQAPAAVPGAVGTNAPATGPAPGTMTQQITMPGSGGPFPNGASTRPFARFHRAPIHLPPPPPAAPAPAAASAPPPPPAQ